MPNRFQIKRTTTTGLLPNVSNSSNTSYIAAGELAINLTDRKLLSSNGSATFEIGANLASMVVGTGFTLTSGNANFDSGVLFVDGTNDRVGIGTSSPGMKLDVQAGISTAYSASSYTTPIARVYNTYGGAGNTTAMIAYSDANYSSIWSAGLVENGGGAYTGDFVWQNRVGESTFAEAMRLTSAGNLGIGNTTPSHTLSVTGTTNLGGVVTATANVILGTTTISANGSVGTAGQILTSGGSGNVYWSTGGGGGSPGGANTQIQFNDGGSFGGDAGLTYNKTTDALTVAGALTVNGAVTVPNTAALGNTTITGFANVSSTLNAAGAITQNGNQVLHAGNYTSYAPSLTGSGASGNWGINVTGSSASTTGNAGTATTLQTARTITVGSTGRSFNGSADISWSLADIGAAATSHTHSISAITDAARWWNNFGDNHTTRTSFDATTPSIGFGWRYVQGSTNGPGVNGADQYYSVYVGLGNDYGSTGSGSYGMQIAYPRNVTTPYITIRYNENNSLGAWQKISAGYADSAGAVDFNNLTNKGSGTGTYTTSGDFRAPIFYDSNDTSFYVDPASSSILGTITAKASSDAQLYLNGNGTSWAGITWTDVAGTDYMWYNGSGSTFAIGGDGSNVANKKLHVHGGVTIGSGLVSTSVSTNGLLVETRVDAPIFYDSANTSFYVDPASTSNINALNSGRIISSDNTYDGGIKLSTASGSAYISVNRVNDAAGQVGFQYQSGASTRWYNYLGGTANDLYWYNANVSSNVMTLDWATGYLTQSVSVRAPIFYDSANTSFYVDPASTSNLSGLTVVNTITGSITGNANTATSASQVGGISSDRVMMKRRTRINTADSTSLNSSITTPEMGFTYGGSGEPVGPYIAFGGLSGNIDYSCQLVGAYSSGGNDFRIRTRNDDTATWNAWRTIITDGNYNSYAPTLTGTGASGTWGISVTGSAGSTAQTLTRGTYLTGDNFNGSAATTWAVDATTTATASKIVARNSSGDDFRRYGFAEYFNMSHGASGATTDTVFYSSGDDYIRKNNATGFRASLNVPTRTGGDASGNWGINITGNAAGATFSNDSATQDNITTRTDSGFYQSSTGTTAEGWPLNDGAWQHMISCTHSNDDNYFAMQLGSSFYSQGLFYRATGGSGSTAWSRVALYDNSYSSNLRANIFYDSDNTGYYVDPTGGTSLRTSGGDWRSDSGSWSGEFAGKIQYHSDNWYFQATSGWRFRNAGGSDVVVINSNGFATFSDGISINSGDGSSSLYMSDSDEGERVIHCNSNRIGFLTQAGGWGSWCNDDGSWWTPIFYDSNDSAYYVDPASTTRLNTTRIAGKFYAQGGTGVDECCGSDATISVGGSSARPPSISWHYSGVMQGNMQGNQTGWRKIYFYDDQGNGLGIHATGQIASNADVIAYYSDKRLKKDFVRVVDHWNVINNLTGYRFTWNERSGEIDGFRDKVGMREVGLIAQDVKAVYPEAIAMRTEGPEDDPYMTIKHDRFTAVFIEALKDLRKELDEVKEENKKLREMINGQ